MATLGSLLYYIKAKNSEFKSKMDESKNKIKEFEGQVEKSKKTLQDWTQTAKKVGLGASAILAAVTLEIRKATSENVEYQNSLIGLRSIAESLGEDIEAVTQAAKELSSDGLMGISDAATGLKNLLQAGFGLEESIVLIERFKDSAAFGRQGALSFGEAVRSATEGIKNGNSILVDNAGVTKNLSVMLQEAGYSAQDLMHAADDAGIRMAIFNGIVNETRHQVGDAAKLADELGGALSRTGESTRRLHRSIGTAVEDRLKRYLDALDNIINKTAEWIEKNQELADTLITGLTGILAALLGLSTGVIVLEKIIAALQTIRALAMSNSIVFAFQAWASGAATAAEAVSFLAGRFAPFLVGGAIVIGLASLWNWLKKIREEILGINNDLNVMDLADIETEISRIDEKLEELRPTYEGYKEGNLGAFPQLTVSMAQDYKDLLKERERLEKRRQELINIQSQLDGDGDSEAGGSGGLIETKLTPDDIFAKEQRRWQALITLGEKSVSEYKKWLEEQFEATKTVIDETGLQHTIHLYTPETRAQIKKELEQMEADTQEILNKIREAATEALILEPDEDSVRKLAALNYWDMDIAEQAYKELAQFQLTKMQTLQDVEDETLRAFLEKNLELQRSQIFEKYDEMQLAREEENERLMKERELRKQQFLLSMREISYHDYLEYIEKQLEAEEQYTDRWYQLMRERQNTLQEIVQKDMQDLIDTSNKMYDNEEERSEWLIKQLEALKERYAENKVIVALLADEIERLKDVSTDSPEAEESLNWLTDYLVDIGYEIETANQKFGEWKDNIVDGLTDAIVKGEDFLDTLKNVTDQIAAMILQQGLVEPFVNMLFTSMFPAAHTGALVTTTGLVRDLPSFHTGGVIKPDERIIKVQTGERILSREQNKAFEAGLLRPEVNIEVVNNTGVPIQTRKEVQFDGPRTIIRMFMDGYARNVEGIQDIFKR